MIEDLKTLITNQIETNRFTQAEEIRKKQEAIERDSQLTIRELSRLEFNIETAVKAAISKNECYAWVEVGKDVYSIISGRAHSLPNGARVVNPFERILKDFAKVGVTLTLNERDTSFTIDGAYCEQMSRHIDAKWRKI